MVDNLNHSAEGANTLTRTLAERISVYRQTNPFKTAADLKFVPGMTREVFDRIRDQVTFMTDLNTAPHFELMSLWGMTEPLAAHIIEYRDRHVIENLLDIFSDYERGEWPPHYFEWAWAMANIDTRFVTTEYLGKTVRPDPDVTVNINTAPRLMLIEAGLAAAEADIVLDLRQRGGYPLKSLYELADIRQMNFTVTRINALSDNFVTKTDINNATEHELRSLFGGSIPTAARTFITRNRPFTNMEQLANGLAPSLFREIEPHIYIGNYYSNYLNINTASRAQLINAGLTAAQISAVTQRQRTMLRPDDLPNEILSMGGAVTMITNINTATPYALSTLGSFMTSEVINEILRYRQDQPFGSVSEVRDLFWELNMIPSFILIERFISVR
jgi:DNA uptake protein ComE-like DNA-binding protein